MECQVCTKILFQGDCVYGVCSDCAKKAINIYRYRAYVKGKEV
jgi:hypothetical protein